MVKVCYVVDELNIGGLEKNLKNIVLNLDKEKYKAQVWCLKKRGVLAQDLESEGIVVKAFDFAGRLRINLLLKLIQELKKGDFQIIHSHGIFPAIWAGLAAIPAGIPVRIAHCQNLYEDVSRRNRIKFKLLSFFTTAIVAVSEAVKKSLVEYFSIDPRMITVVYNCAAEPEITDQQKKKAIRQELNIKDDAVVIGTVSRLQEHKGQQYLIEAIFNLQSSIPNLKCLIVGDGPFKSDLELKVEVLGLKDKVIFTGLRRDIENLLSIMDTFVQSSTLKEGLPLALAEAASAGLPLVATDIGGNPEIVINGENGFIVAPKNVKALAEKIQYLLENYQEKKRMGDNSRRLWQEKFNLGKMIKEVEAMYERYL